MISLRIAAVAALAGCSSTAAEPDLAAPADLATPADSAAAIDLAAPIDSAAPKAPADRVFAVAVADNAGGPPQAAPKVALKFGGGTPGPDTVVAVRMAQPPAIDGDGAEWAAVTGSTVPLIPPGQAVNLDKSTWDQEWIAATGKAPTYDYGITDVTVKAGFDDGNLYFLLTWKDASESRFRGEWKHDGVAFQQSAESDDGAFLAFNVSAPAFDTKGCAGFCHVGEMLGDVSPGGKAYRFRMHTSVMGEIGDVWRWRATRSNPMAAADDQYWDEVSRKGDATNDWAVDNRFQPDGGTAAPAFMGNGGVNSSPDYIFDKATGKMPAAVAFDGAGAMMGARIPGFVHQQASAMRDDVRAAGKWSNGVWTVEYARKLVTGDAHDAQFPLQ